ncbi:MAG: GNAT family N-acetyltransferase [Saprospiraceae bacterium]|nr:GNAT family N-acetyltransferase [Saprospiraceae bacterium]
MRELTIIENNLPPATYRHLRVSSGLSAKSVEASEKGLPNSLYTVLLQKEGQAVGMGRLIGDGGCFCQVVDICVAPDFQGQGLGKIIMQHITNYIHDKLPDTCYVSLIADGDACFLYEKFGFRDTLPTSKGIYLDFTVL